MQLRSALDTTTGSFVNPYDPRPPDPDVFRVDSVGYTLLPKDNTALLVGAAVALLVMGWALARR